MGGKYLVVRMRMVGGVARHGIPDDQTRLMYLTRCTAIAPVVCSAPELVNAAFTLVCLRLFLNEMYWIQWRMESWVCY